MPQPVDGKGSSNFGKIFPKLNSRNEGKRPNSHPPLRRISGYHSPQTREGRLKRMRTRHGLQEEPDSIEPARQSQTWLRAESSEALAGINEECLELLTAQSMVRTLQPQPMLGDLADLWRSLDARARRRAAECPYLLVDAGFADARRWRFPSGHAMSESVASGDRGAAILHDAGLERRHSSSSAVCSRVGAHQQCGCTTVAGDAQPLHSTPRRLYAARYRHRCCTASGMAETPVVSPRTCLA